VAIKIELMYNVFYWLFEREWPTGEVSLGEIMKGIKPH
jgi:hypothetical protein